MTPGDVIMIPTGCKSETSDGRPDYKARDLFGSNTVSKEAYQSYSEVVSELHDKLHVHEESEGW